MPEQEYIFVDASGKCFDSFAEVEDTTDYHRMVANMFAGEKRFEVGDMLCFRDDLINDGFKWSRDFYIKKVT